MVQTVRVQDLQELQKKHKMLKKYYKENSIYIYSLGHNSTSPNDALYLYKLARKYIQQFMQTQFVKETAIYTRFKEHM